ncbi:MAG: phBC6A51 family helix-turn-helix protein [Deltaproteobacteria bacterium]|nr:phBC6A51 family helix-turn-helix protein [Deltaproteobacteria bacterium]MDZ4346911.1 phBC6A51 family helix-turn-helix protein [Candidatus Binatia bacterium]
MNTDQEIELTRRQRRIIPLLLSKSVTEACTEARVGRKTLYDWLKQEPFKNELGRARDELFSTAMDRLKANTEKALDKLITLMDSGEKDDTQVRCAQTVLEYSWKLKQTQDLEKRIEQLEQALGQGR